LLVFSVVLVAFASARVVHPSGQWSFFKSSFGKSYGSQAEEAQRQRIFSSNLELINKHNIEYDEGKHDFFLGVNQFADLTNAEFRRVYNGYKGHSNSALGVSGNPINVKDLPVTVDWRDKGYVTPVKNQGSCGSCWAFSTTGSLEGQHFKATQKLVSLSEQNLVDCSQAEGNEGCNGGLMDEAFDYIKKNGGIDTEESYPYKGTDDKCAFNKANVGATLTSWVDVKMGDENALQDAVANVGPIAVAIDASSIFFQFYMGGVYNIPWCSSTNLDHGVLAVGYGVSTNNKPYWLVKNSWGVSWGEYGYIRMSRNKKNQCGIATNASYPIV